MLRRVSVLIVASLVLAGSFTTSAPAADAARRTAAAPRLQWKPCAKLTECAHLDVPVDYQRPDGATVSLLLARARAADPSRRLGSLVVNFGGPGDPGTETLPDALNSFPRAIRGRFDIVSFDPRGTGGSRPIDCVDDATFERLWSEDPTPNSDADLPHYYDGSSSSVDFIAECVKNQGSWLAQVGTRDVARDLDRIRAALGERKLTYLGYSYGTAIGAVYAQLFPKRIRAMVLDGAVDLSASPSDKQLGNAKGFEHALHAYLADCAADRHCAFYSKGDPRGALQQLRDRFEQGLVLPSDDDRKAGVSEFYTTLLAALYDRASWPVLSQALRMATRGDGTYLRLVTDLYTGRHDDGTYNNFQEAIGIINCDDRPDKKVSFDEYRATYERLKRDFPFFGPALGAQPIGCDPRLPMPAPGESLGDVRTSKAPPILVIGTTHDPATPYAGAQDLAKRLRGARLLTFDSTEHASFGKGVVCIDDAVDTYLISLRLPARGTTCSPS